MSPTAVGVSMDTDSDEDTAEAGGLGSPMSTARDDTFDTNVDRVLRTTCSGPSLFKRVLAPPLDARAKSTTTRTKRARVMPSVARQWQQLLSVQHMQSCFDFSLPPLPTHPVPSRSGDSFFSAPSPTVPPAMAAAALTFVPVAHLFETILAAFAFNRTPGSMSVSSCSFVPGACCCCSHVPTVCFVYMHRIRTHHLSGTSSSIMTAIVFAPKRLQLLRRMWTVLCSHPCLPKFVHTTAGAQEYPHLAGALGLFFVCLRSAGTCCVGGGACFG